VKENCSVTNRAKVVIEVIGEGRTDVGLPETSDKPTTPSPPNKGIVSIVVKSLCGKPDAMLVTQRHYASLQGKTRAQKVHFAKRQAIYSPCKPAGIVFVLDSEGDLKGRTRELIEGRDRQYPDFPTAVGVAHPCIEAWLLADTAAVAEGLNLAQAPAVPENPEGLPAPCHDGKNNPKAVLRAVAGRGISANDKDRIAATMDLTVLRERCPLGFAPFAEEVQQHIQPLFPKRLASA
jgi:Domain of unknown function (DUF4276)